MVADRDHGNVGCIQIANDRHIAEHVGVAGMVNLHAVGKLDDVATGLTAIDDLVAIRNSAGVIGVHHGDFDVANGLCAALVHGRNLLYALLFQPVTKLGNRNHDRLMVLGNLNRVADVIEVAMSAEHDIHALNFLLVFRAHGIAHDPRVHQNRLAARRCDAKRGVTQPCEFDAIKIHRLMDVR